MGKRIGIVGTGFIAMKHLAAFKAQKKAEIVGMCTYSNMEKLHAICEEHQIIPFASMDEMLEKGELDAVVLCSVTACHYQEILKAAAAGVSMLVEKPVVGETEQYQRVRRAIEQNRVMLFPGHNFMYRRPLSQMKKLLDPSEVGGTPFLGIQKPVIKAHGGSNARAIENAVLRAKEYAESGFIADIQANIEHMRVQPGMEKN